jgi:hypothetical protein
MHVPQQLAAPPGDAIMTICGANKCSVVITPYVCHNTAMPACSRAFPLVPQDAAALAAPPGDAIQALWVGHASMLVQMEGVAFMTDPFFSQRSSPVQFMGPRRWVQGVFGGMRVGLLEVGVSVWRVSWPAAEAGSSVLAGTGSCGLWPSWLTPSSRAQALYSSWGHAGGWVWGARVARSGGACVHVSSLPAAHAGSVRWLAQPYVVCGRACIEETQSGWHELLRPHVTHSAGKNGGHSSMLPQQPCCGIATWDIVLRTSRVEACATAATAAAAACRAVQPALVPEDAAMPRLDFVVLSHNHYDHLDAGSVDRLHRYARQSSQKSKLLIPAAASSWCMALASSAAVAAASRLCSLALRMLHHPAY